VALIPAHRRYLGPAALALLVLVMLGSLVPDPVGTWHPFMVAQKASFGGKVDALCRAVRGSVGDNFGYARTLPYLRGAVEYAVMTPSDPRVYFGRMHLFYSGENVVNQSTGSLYRPDQIRHFVDVVAAMRRALASAGGDIVVLVPPNAQSIPTHDQPAWWHISGPLEYDLAMRELREGGIATIDLKAAFVARPDRDLLYRHADSHWRWNAALLAFNMTMNSIGHDEWSLDPATSLTPLSPVPAGDLARLLGLQDRLRDADYAVRIDPPAGAWTAIDVFRALPSYAFDLRYAFERASQGERLLVVGDSFTHDYWEPLLKPTGAARIAWIPFSGCTFDFTDLARFAPTHVIVAPTERNIACGLTNWPHRLPRDPAMASR
jgi:acetyltransferase AlgX (SGNH hydrolase-like protein)